MSMTTEVDDFIDDPKTDAYASWFLMLSLLPVSRQLKLGDWIDIAAPKLFCDYYGVKYRVTGCDEVGDVWLTTNFQQHIGYELKVLLSSCENWSADA